MGITPYHYVPNQPLKQWGKDQYVPLPIDDIASYRKEVKADQEKAAQQELDFIDTEAFIEDQPYLNEQLAQSRKEAEELSNMNAYENPAEYNRKRQKWTNKWANTLGEVAKVKKAKETQRALYDKYGTDALYFGGKRPDVASHIKNPNTGQWEVNPEYDPSSQISQQEDYGKSERTIADRAVGDIEVLGLGQSSSEYFLKHGSLDIKDEAKINSALSDANIMGIVETDPALKQRLRILTEQNNLNPNIHTGEQAMQLAEQQIADEIRDYAKQTVYKKLRENYLQNPEAMADLKLRTGAGEKELEKRSEYNINISSMGKGKTTINPNDLGKMIEGTEGTIKGTWSYIPDDGEVLMITPGSNEALTEATTGKVMTNRDLLFNDYLKSVRGYELWSTNPDQLSNSLDRGLIVDLDQLDDEKRADIETKKNDFLMDLGWDGNPNTKTGFEEQFNEYQKQKVEELKKIGNGDIQKGVKIKAAQEFIATELPANFRDGIDIRYKTNDNAEKKTLWNPETQSYETFYEYKYTGYIPKEKAKEITTDIDADLFSFDWGNKQLSTVLDEYSELGVVNKPSTDDGQYTFDGVKRVSATDFRTQSDLKWNYDNSRQGGDATNYSRTATDKDLADQVNKQQRFNDNVANIINTTTQVAGGSGKGVRGVREQSFYNQLIQKGISKEKADKALRTVQNSNKDFEMAVYDVLSSVI